jgi:excisionase family DNA binding protein
MPMMTTKEVTVYLGYSYSRMRQLICLGQAPPYMKIGNAVRFWKSDINEWLEAHRVPAAGGCLIIGTGKNFHIFHRNR